MSSRLSSTAFFTAASSCGWLREGEAASAGRAVGAGPAARTRAGPAGAGGGAPAAEFSDLAGEVGGAAGKIGDLAADVGAVAQPHRHGVEDQEGQRGERH